MCKYQRISEGPMELLFPMFFLFFLPFFIPLGFVLFFVAAGLAILGFTLIGDSDTRIKGIIAIILAAVRLLLSQVTAELTWFRVIFSIFHALR